VGGASPSITASATKIGLDSGRMNEAWREGFASNFRK